MKVRVKLPSAAKELVDGVTSLVELAGKTVASGSRTVREAKRTTRKVKRTLKAARDAARAGREAASELGTTARSGGETELDFESGTVIVDLRGTHADEGDEGNHR